MDRRSAYRRAPARRPPRVRRELLGDIAAAHLLRELATLVGQRRVVLADEDGGEPGATPAPPARPRCSTSARSSSASRLPSMTVALTPLRRPRARAASALRTKPPRALDPLVSLDGGQVDLDEVRRRGRRPTPGWRPRPRRRAGSGSRTRRSRRRARRHRAAHSAISRGTSAAARRLADQRVAHLGLEILRHPKRGEHVLVGDRVLVRERAARWRSVSACATAPAAPSQSCANARPWPRATPPSRSRRRRRSPASRRRRLRGDQVEQLLEGDVRVGHGAILLDPAPVAGHRPPCARK